ncbi:MAG TPA: M48 family metallopeptidase [Gemmatimonadales bacterium]|jgi:Zn-dependent protease with chaperone function
MTTLPAARPRVSLLDIAPVSWEHPADRAALQALRAIPGLDQIMRKVISLLGGERGIRLLFQGDAIRVGPTQFPMLWALHIENCATFGWGRVPEVYVTQTPIFNAGAYGVDDPFIVIHSSAFELLDHDEQRALLAHELGHVMSGHALYSTIAEILIKVSLGSLPFPLELLALPVRLAILEWSRKSELSADRAEVLGTQDLNASMRLFMKMAGGANTANVRPGDLNLVPFMEQASEYATQHDGFDIVYKLMNTLALTHPMNVVRAGEIQKWVQSGAYDRIVAGEYTRRGSEASDRPLSDDMREAGKYYRDEFSEFAGEVRNAAKRAAGRARDAFNDARDKQAG